MISLYSALLFSSRATIWLRLALTDSKWANNFEVLEFLCFLFCFNSWVNKLISYLALAPIVLVILVRRF